MKNYLTAIVFAAGVFMAEAEPSSTEARDSDPAKPQTTPERKNDELLTATVTAIQGVDGKAETVIAYHNHADKSVKSFDYWIDYIDARGGVLSGRFGEWSPNGIAIESGTEYIVRDSRTPKGCVEVRVTVEDVKLMGPDEQLLGYWQADIEKNREQAKREKREIDPVKEAVDAKAVTEFKDGKMTLHLPEDLMEGNFYSVLYTVMNVDKASNRVSLATERNPEVEAVLKGRELTLKIDGRLTFFKRMSAEEFAKRKDLKILKPSEISRMDSGLFRQLTPPITITEYPLEGSDRDRKGKLALKNDSGKAISRIAGTLRCENPHGNYLKAFSLSDFSRDGRSGDTLNPGESHTIEETFPYVAKTSKDLKGVVASITFADNSTWPPMPAGFPEGVNDEPVVGKIIGLHGSGSLSKTAIAFFNHGEKPVKGVVFCVKDLDPDGDTLSGSYGYVSWGVTDTNEGKTIMESGSGLADCVTSAPPSDVSNARVEIVEVFYTGGGSWKR